MSNPTEGQLIDRNDYLAVWLNLECIEIAGNRLYRVTGSTCDDIELVLGVRTAKTYTTYVSSALDDERAAATLALPGKKVFDVDIVTAILGTVTEVRREVSYHFPERPSITPRNVAAIGDTADTLDTFAVVIDNEIVSRAWSVRRTQYSAEVAVETVEHARGNGFATQCVAAWANYQLAQNKVPIYSHRKGNEASAGVAQAVGAKAFAEVISYY